MTNHGMAVVTFFAGSTLELCVFILCRQLRYNLKKIDIEKKISIISTISNYANEKT